MNRRFCTKGLSLLLDHTQQRQMISPERTIKNDECNMSTTGKFNRSPERRVKVQQHRGHQTKNSYQQQFIGFNQNIENQKENEEPNRSSFSGLNRHSHQKDSSSHRGQVYQIKQQEYQFEYGVRKHSINFQPRACPNAFGKLYQQGFQKYSDLIQFYIQDEESINYTNKYKADNYQQDKRQVKSHVLAALSVEELIAINQKTDKIKNDHQLQSQGIKCHPCCRKLFGNNIQENLDEFNDSNKQVPESRSIQEYEEKPRTKDENHLQKTKNIQKIRKEKLKTVEPQTISSVAKKKPRDKRGRFLPTKLRLKEQIQTEPRKSKENCRDTLKARVMIGRSRLVSCRTHE